jgi:hypothetical protein
MRPDPPLGSSAAVGVSLWRWMGRAFSTFVQSQPNGLRWGSARCLRMIWPMQAEKVIDSGSRARDERLRVRLWRREQFLGLGFTLSDSAALAKSGADLEEARKLIARGCGHATAFRIMR